MSSFTSLASLAIIIISGAIVGFFAVKAKLPTIIGYILAGVALSLIFPLLGFSHELSSELVGKIAQFGVALLLFAAGIEFSYSNIKKIRNLVIVGTLTQTVVVITVTTIVMQILGFTQYQSFFIGVIAATSSTAFVLKMLEQREELGTKSSTIMVGWLIMQDILIIALFLLLQNFAPNEVHTGSIFESILKGALLIAISLLAGKFIIPKIFAQIAATGSRELLLISVVALSIGFALFAEVMGVSFTLGAFLTGLALSDSFIQHEVFSEIKPLRDLFSMVFFVSIGTFFQIDTVVHFIPVILVIIALLLLVKTSVIILINLYFKVHAADAVKVGVGIFQIGEFAFLCISIGLSKNWIDDSIYTIVLVSTILSMILTPILYASSNKIYKFIEKLSRDHFPNFYRKFFINSIANEKSKREIHNHIIICGYGKVGRYIATALGFIKEKFIIIEVDATLAKLAEDEGHKVIFGDATNPDILKTSFLENAKAIVYTLPKSDNTFIQDFVAIVKKINQNIPIIVRSSITLENTENISNVIEPEFEAAVRIINKLAPFSNYNKQVLAQKIRSFRRSEIKEIVANGNVFVEENITKNLDL